MAETISIVGFDTLVTAIKNSVQAQGNLQQTINRVFPQATGTDTEATGGAAILPANPVGFLEVYVPSLSATVKIPYYS